MSGSWSVGIDVHDRYFVYTVLDGNGNRLKTATVRGSTDKLIEELRRVKSASPGFSIAFEASTNYGHLFERFRKVARSVEVAHPGKVRLIFNCRQKNDRIDSKKLAMLLFFKSIPQVHVPAADVRTWRKLVTGRIRLVERRTASKSRIRAMLRTHDIAAPKGLWTRRGIEWLRELELDSLEDKLMLDIEVDEMVGLDGRIRRTERALDERARRHPGVFLLTSIPGVGTRTAEAFIAYVDDPGRFRSAAKVASYFGLVPCQDQSGPRNRLGHITRQGPSVVRALAVEAAWQGIRRSPKIRKYYERVRRGDPERTKKAVVATAHYLVRVMHAMLSTGELWREDPAA